MTLHGITDLCDIDFRLIVLCFQIAQPVSAFFEQSEKSLIFLGVEIL